MAIDVGKKPRSGRAIRGRIELLVGILAASVFFWPGVALCNGPGEAHITDDASGPGHDSQSRATAEEGSRDEEVVKASGLQPQPLLLPRPEIQPETGPRATQAAAPSGPRDLASRMFGLEGVSPSLLGARQAGAVVGAAAEVVSGSEAQSRVTTDAGSLLGNTPGMLSTGVQRRTPIVNDPRIRGSRVGQLAASGSYWIPARIDLDTAISKLDSRIIQDVIVVNGPYSARFGPGLSFIDVELLKSPRYADGFEAHGSTSVDFKTNGQQWYGRQSFWGGSTDWGFRVGYGHRTGNDYLTGNGTGMPASYNSGDVDLALGKDLSPDSHLEVNALRLDQGPVEFPGYAFDVDYLKTDAVEIRYVLENQPWCDRLELDVWYNHTHFFGDAQRPGKRRQFPFFDFMHYVGYTDVDATSTGYQLATTWGTADDPQFTAGLDFRYLQQELNEIASGRIGFNIFTNANSPLPRSNWSDPGLFVEEKLPIGDDLEVVAGARVDLVSAAVIDDPAKLQHLGNQNPQSSLAEILGTDQFDQDFATWSVFLNGTYHLTPHWNLLVGAGHGERPPSLTELYVAQSYMFVLQNGQNSLTGDPRLRPERAWQCDLGVSCEYERFRSGLKGFYTWIQDYITFENLWVVHGPPAGNVQQVQLKYVNTDLATLTGFEAYAQYDLNDWLTPFATLKYVEGTDRTRNGSFATQKASGSTPSQRVYGLSRGFFSGVTGSSQEPLPGILPLEGRLGLRVHQAAPKPRWSVELSARLADAQLRVAESLMETPTPGFVVGDVRSTWRKSDHLLLVAGVENFTNQNYREHLDFRSPDGQSVYQPGVNFYFGSELTY